MIPIFRGLNIMIPIFKGLNIMIPIFRGLNIMIPIFRGGVLLIRGLGYDTTSCWDEKVPMYALTNAGPPSAVEVQAALGFRFQDSALDPGLNPKPLPPHKPVLMRDRNMFSLGAGGDSNRVWTTKYFPRSASPKPFYTPAFSLNKKTRKRPRNLATLFQQKRNKLPLLNTSLSYPPRIYWQNDAKIQHMKQLQFETMMVLAVMWQ